MNALRYVRPGEGHIIAVTLQPCSDCIKNIVAHGIFNIYYLDEYKRDEAAIQIGNEFGAILTKL
jgi:deoxycytidylate deaminase